MKKLCVFDLDGTLVDSIGDIAAAVNRSLEKMQRPPHPQEAYYSMVGNGMEMLCRRAIGEATEAEVATLVKLYREDYLCHCCCDTTVYPGIHDLLRELDSLGICMAIFSNKPQEQTEEVLQNLLGDIPFSVVIGGGSGYPTKPDPTALWAILEETGVKPEETWYVGDSDVDAELGKAADVPTIGVLWGFRGAEELQSAGADYLVKSVEELRKILLEDEI